MPISLKNMTVGKKLLLGFLSIALLVTVMGYFGVLGTRQISRSFDLAANSSIPAIRALLEIKSTANEIAAQIAGFQLIGDALSREEGTETGAQKYGLIGRVEKIDRWAERYERALTAGEGDVRLTFAQKLREAEASVVNSVFELLALKERGISGTELLGKTQELARAQDRLEEVIAEAIDDELAYIKEHNVSVSSAAEAMLRVNIWVSVLTLAFAATVGLVFARSIGAPIRRLKESVERLGISQAGESAQVPVGSGDEIGQLWRSFNQMTERLEKTTVSRDTLAHELVERQKAEQALAAVQGQLVQVQKMEAIGRLAGGVAHDFNNMLTAIIGYSHLGQSELQTGESRIRTSFREIQKAAELASELTQKLLAFSRHQVVEPKVVSLGDLILGMDGMLRRLIGEDIELVTLPAPDSGMVRVDSGEMEQVLTNLAVNARDAMPSGGKLLIETSNVTLEQEYARIHPDVSSGDYVVLAVTDTGTGMSDEVKAHIFEPFFTTKDRAREQAGAIDLLWHRLEERRSHHRRKRTGQGSYLQGIFATR